MLKNVHLASQSKNISSEAVEEGMEHHDVEQVSDDPSALTGKKLSCQNLQRNDSLDMESRRYPKSSRVHIHIPFFPFVSIFHNIYLRA